MTDENKPADAAHVLFPSDVPKVSPKTALEFAAVVDADRTAAAMRLAGNHPGKPATDAEAKPAAGDDAASKLFKADADASKEFDGKVVEGVLDPFRIGAIGDGDTERAEALQVATAGLIEDAKAAGTSSEDMAAAMDIVKERSGILGEPDVAEMQAEEAETLGALQSELGSSFEGDISAARAMITDLEKVSPGIIDTLERTGAGNDIRLVRKVITEARRRGY